MVCGVGDGKSTNKRIFPFLKVYCQPFLKKIYFKRVQECSVQVMLGKKISRREGVYSARNSQLIEKFLVRGISSVYVIMGSSEHDRKKMTLF